MNTAVEIMVVKKKHFKVIDGGHDWPGVWGNLDIDASIEIWRFFSRFNIYGPISTSTLQMEKDVFTLYPRISDDQIIVISDKKETYAIYDLNGKHIVYGVLKNGENIISYNHMQRERISWW